jgi:hypothetical protein
MVISIAMLGIGSAGTVLSIYPIRKQQPPHTPLFQSGGGGDLKTRASVYAMLAGISIILSYIISNHISFEPVKLLWDRTQIFYVALYCFVLSIPFFFTGILIATVFLVQSESSESIYCSDLLGAGIGSLTVLGLLNIAGPEYSVLTASTLCFIASFVTGGKKIRTFITVFIAANILFFITHPDFINVRLSPYKNLSLSLKYPGAEHLRTYHNSFSRIDTLKSPAVRFAPGLSLTYLDYLPEQIGISIDGSEMNAVTRTDDEDALTFLKFLPSSLVYEIKNKTPHPRNKFGAGSNPLPHPPPLTGGGKGEGENVLILEPKGGLQALMAEYYGFKKIHKVESNPLLIKVIRKDFMEFSGKIFEHNTWTGFGRSWLHRSQIHPVRKEKNSNGVYDIIDLPMTGTSVSGAFGISEDYRFTVESFREYLRVLKKDGFMSISLYIIPPSRTELRILTTAITALEQAGIKNVSRHISAIKSWDSITILVKKSPLNQEEIQHIKEFARDRRFDLVHYPGIKEEETNIYVRMPSNEYFQAFKSILGSETRGLFIKDYLFDITPVYDEKPFFHYYLKLKNIKVIYEVMGQKWQYFIEEGYLLPVIFVMVLILSLIMILLPVLFKVRILKQALPTLFYFSMLGLGFMFVEVTMIQKSILSLEYPAYAVATVLATILISSGIGSLLSSRFPDLRTPYLLLALCVLIFIYSLVFPLLLSFISPYYLKLKIPLVFIALSPLGFFMGIPFPMGIKFLGQRNKELIPWAWAINGCLSVLAPILTIMFAMTLGFKMVLWFGALTYLLAFVSLRKLIR